MMFKFCIEKASLPNEDVEATIVKPLAALMMSNCQGSLARQAAHATFDEVFFGFPVPRSSSARSDLRDQIAGLCNLLSEATGRVTGVSSRHQAILAKTAGWL